MRYRITVVLSGAVLTLAGLIAGGTTGAGAAPRMPSITAGPPNTVTAIPTGTVPASPGPTETCPPVLPVYGAPSAVTATSVTISYTIFVGRPCGYDPPITVSFFASEQDASQWRNPVTSVESGWERSGTIIVTGLTPDTTYWFRFSSRGARDLYAFTSVRTAPSPDCDATLRIDSSWSSGFVATVTVRNTGSQTLDTWRVWWRWPGDQRIQSLWNGVSHGSDADVAIGNTPYNATLPPGGSTTFGMLVGSSTQPGTLVLTCDH